MTVLYYGRMLLLLMLLSVLVFCCVFIKNSTIEILWYFVSPCRMHDDAFHDPVAVMLATVGNK
jgi:hypothetical protein